MKTEIRIFCSLTLLAALLTCCNEPDPFIEEDPFKVIALAPIKDNIPYQALGSGKIVIDRIHELNIDNCGFYVIDVEKKTANGFRLNTGICTPNISPDGTKIACSLYTSQGAYDIFIMSIDGSNCFPVFQSSYQDFFPTWTPDGSKVLCFGSSYVCQLYMQSPVENATDRVELTKFYYGVPDWFIEPIGGFSMSPGGKLVCVNRGIKPDGILSIDPYVGKSGVSNLLPRTYPQMFESPVFSPDGQKIAFLSDEIDTLSGWKAIEVKSMNPDGTNLTRVVSVKTYKSPVQYAGVHRFVSLCWSPDGTKILFTAPTEEYGCHLFVVNADGSGLTQVTDDVNAYDLDVSWSR
ncbi:MAG: hypothetical protein NTV01_16200 [Bacteroidia bacterium]|nr:hypothetical protein [Bacteroidia bacterium]